MSNYIYLRTLLWCVLFFHHDRQRPFSRDRGNKSTGFVVGFALREQFSTFFIYSIRKHSVPVSIPYTIFYALRLSPFTIKC